MSDLEYDPHAYAGELDHREDHAPGDEPEESAGHWVRNSNLGLGFSVVLTVAAFVLAGSHLIWAPGHPGRADRAGDRPDGRAPGLLPPRHHRARTTPTTCWRWPSASWWCS